MIKMHNKITNIFSELKLEMENMKIKPDSKYE